MQTCNEIKGSYDKIILTRVQSYIGACLLPLTLLGHTHNNTDSSKDIFVPTFYHGGGCVASACVPFGYLLHRCEFSVGGPPS